MASGYFSCRSDRQECRSASSLAKSESRPEVGRYTAKWMVSGRFGGLKISGRKAEDETGIIVMKASCSLLHIAIVPPKHLDDLKARSESYKSEEFNEEK